MRTVAIICNRCLSPIVEQASTLEATSGPLRQSLDGPADLCPDCATALRDWFRGGRPEMANDVARDLTPTKGA